ncbi:rod shape-determining protein MreC [Pseudoflavonifractor sp. 524-17]|uniref:rod shape-determining protein MreC n=1 Tax=Pseudoflavonifractor sp. 524-17 TaxID=2304577 RepID=UPI0013798005|nr:rod shape-determining protein MreC [Pseudoflavonifractor sp. 524-17]NCE63640.1 rod shape-determining protein MreC [Pseudoflavonifractor sp. 524-17]
MKDFLRDNGGLLLIIAVLLALIVAVTSALLKGVADPLSNLTNLITTPIRDGVSAVASWGENWYTDLFRQDETRAELEELRRMYADLEEKYRDAQQALEENVSLRNLLGLAQQRRDLDLESAVVTAHGTSNWDSTLTISKGSDAGVALGDCVIDEYGYLVGVIDELGSNWSVVMTVVDSDLEMGGLIARTDGTAILEGDFTLMEQGRLKLSYLPENSELMAGDQVLTSGLSGIYPARLVVGHVEEVRTEASGMTRYAVIAPETDLNGLKQVFVIKSFDIVE